MITFSFAHMHAYAYTVHAAEHRSIRAEFETLKTFFKLLAGFEQNNAIHILARGRRKKYYHSETLADDKRRELTIITKYGGEEEAGGGVGVW